MDYLKDHQYYEDLYDLLTVKRCLEFENSPVFDNPPGLNSKLTSEQKRSMGRIVAEVGVYYVKGDRYRQKSEAIRDWEFKDRQRQNFFDTTPEPQRVSCPKCNAQLKSTLKTLEEPQGEPMRVLFFYECHPCNYRKSVYNNGEQWIYKPTPCPKCHTSLKVSFERTGNVVTTTSLCPKCGYKEIDVDDFDSDRERWEKEKAADLKLLTDFREKYCMNEVEGGEYVTLAMQLKSFYEHQAEKERKEANPAYHKALQLKKLTVIELEKLLIKSLDKGGFIKLTLDKPEIAKYVIISFTAQDSDSTRKEADSTNQLKKLLKKTLEDTNWRLMSEGVTYRLGYVYGRLKGYEREEDLMEIVKK